MVEMEALSLACCGIKESTSSSQPRRERMVVVSRGVYQQSFPFVSQTWRVLGSIFCFPKWVLETCLPVMVPDGPLRKCWTFWTLAVVLYVAIDVPLQIAFVSWIQLPGIQPLSLLTSVSFCLDILVHFRTAYITGQGELVRVPHLIALNYLRGMFIMDLVSALPLDEILHGTSFRTDAVWLGLLKLPRLFRLVRHVKALTRTKYINLVGVARLLGTMLLITHWSACLWHFLSTRVPGWPWIFSKLCTDCSDTAEYVFAFYRCFLLMLGDRPETYNNVERLVAVILLSMGACLYAVVVSSITMLVTNMWSMESRHKQRASMLQDALRYKDAPEEMRIRVDEYYDFMANFDHPGPDGVSLLCELPAALHAEVLSSVFERMLVKVQLFAYCERSFLWRLSQRLRLSLYMPGDVIYNVNSVGHDMYIIWKGAVGLTGYDGCMAALLCDNDHFGELGIMNVSTRRPHRAVALRQCDIMILNLWDLQDAMRDFPDSAQLVLGRARVQLEDHETGPAVWAVSLATGKTPRHELHPERVLHPEAAGTNTAANAPGPGGEDDDDGDHEVTAAARNLTASLTACNLQLLQSANLSRRRSSSSLASCPGTKYDRCGDGDDGCDGGGCRGTPPAVVETTSRTMAFLRSTSLRLRPILSSARRQPPRRTSKPGGNIRRPVSEATEHCSAASAATAIAAPTVEANGSSSFTSVTVLSQPDSPQSYAATSVELSQNNSPDVATKDKRPSRAKLRSTPQPSRIAGGPETPTQSNQRFQHHHVQSHHHHHHHQQLDQYNQHPHRHHHLQQHQQYQLPGSFQSDETLELCYQSRRHRRRQEEPYYSTSQSTVAVLGSDLGSTGSVPPRAGPSGRRTWADNLTVQDRDSRDIESIENAVPIWDIATGCNLQPPPSALRSGRRASTDGLVRGRTNCGGEDSVRGRTVSCNVSSRSHTLVGEVASRSYRHGGDGSSRDFRSDGSVRSLWYGSGDGCAQGGRSGLDESNRMFGTAGGDGSTHSFGARTYYDSSVPWYRPEGGGNGSVHDSNAAEGSDSRGGYRGDTGDLGVSGKATIRPRSSSSTGVELIREKEEHRELRPPHLLVLQGQPFLGLDPLGPLFDDVAKAAAAAAAEQQLRRRMHAGYHAAAAAKAGLAAGGGVNQHRGSFFHAVMYGDNNTTRELVRPVTEWSKGRKLRRSSLHMGSSASPMSGSLRGRLVSDGGALCPPQNTMKRWLNEEPSRNAVRCAVLEKQLAESQQKLASVFQNPFQVPAFAAALSREIEAVTGKLNGQMMAHLRKLQAMLYTMSAQTEELIGQFSSVDDRLQRLEERQHVPFQSGAAAMAVIAAGMSNIGGGGGGGGGGRSEDPSDGREPDNLTISGVGVPLGLLGLQQAPPPVLLPLSAPNGNAGKLVASRQLSMRQTRRLSALEFGTLPDSEPLVDAAAQSPVVAVAAAAGAPTVQLPQAMTVEDAALLAATVQRAVGSASRRRRSALELSLLSYSSLAVTSGQQGLQLPQLLLARGSQSQRLNFDYSKDLDNNGLGDGGSSIADGALTQPMASFRGASMRRSGRRGSWIFLAQALGQESIGGSDTAASGETGAGTGCGHGSSGSVRPESAAGGPSESEIHPLVFAEETARHLSNGASSTQKSQVSFQGAEGLRPSDVPCSSSKSYNDMSCTGCSGVGSGDGGNGGGKGVSGGDGCDALAGKADDAVQHLLQPYKGAPSLRRSNSSFQDRRGSSTALQRRFSLHRSMTSLMPKDGSQHSALQLQPPGPLRMSTISELAILSTLPSEGAYITPNGLTNRKP